MGVGGGVLGLVAVSLYELLERKEGGRGTLG
jgi:hypothetical protein